MQSSAILGPNDPLSNVVIYRIRDNQRRSRARRKEYIQDLEQRLHKFQTERIHATREVQEAGSALIRAIHGKGVFTKLDSRL